MSLLQWSWGSNSHDPQDVREDPVNLFLNIPDAVQPANHFPQLLYLVTQTLTNAHVLQVRSPLSLSLRSMGSTRCPCFTGPAELHLASGAPSGLGLCFVRVVAAVGAKYSSCCASTQLLCMCMLCSAVSGLLLCTLLPELARSHILHSFAFQAAAGSKVPWSSLDPRRSVSVFGTQLHIPNPHC